jgi:hypothetical protein
LTPPPPRGKTAGVAETYRTCRNVVSPHGPEAYPGVLAVRPGPGWTVSALCLQPGESFVARGGERVYGYETIDGVRADAFRLATGDRATLVAAGLPHGLAEWRVDRAGG